MGEEARAKKDLNPDVDEPGGGFVTGVCRRIGRFGFCRGEEREER